MGVEVHIYWREKKPPKPIKLRERRTVEVLRRPDPPPQMSFEERAAWDAANPIQMREVIATEVAALEHFTNGPYLAELQALGAELNARGDTVLVETYAMQPEVHLVSDGALVWRKVLRENADLADIGTGPGQPLHPDEIAAAVAAMDAAKQAEAQERLRLAQIANQEREPTPEERAELDAAMALFLLNRRK